MAKTSYGHQNTTPSSKKTKQHTKPSTFCAPLGGARLRKEKTEEVQNPTETTKTGVNAQYHDLAYDEEDLIEDVGGSNWSQILDQGPALEAELFNNTKTLNVFPYQLQHWAFETSNTNITLAERLEKSKWKYEAEGH